MTTSPLRVRHGAKFSNEIIDVLYRKIVEECARQARPLLIVDPFAGTGEKIGGHPGFQKLMAAHRIEGIEIEPGFINAAWVQQGNALELPYHNDEVDVIFTSPTYGNRFADHHTPKDQSVRHSYTFWLRHNLGSEITDNNIQLHPDNTGQHHYGPRYQQLHQAAYLEAARVLRPGGMLLLNVSNFVSRHAEIDTISWHRAALILAGLHIIEELQVETPRFRFGSNRQRAHTETVLVARL